MVSNKGDPKEISTSGDRYSEEWGHHEEVPEEETNNDHPVTMTANQYREMANSYYANSDFDTALPLYTAALEAFETENSNRHDEQFETKHDDNTESSYIDLKVIYLCNRATCLFRMEMYEESRADALEAVNVSSGKSLKAIYRLAKAQIALKEYTVAIEILQNALQQPLQIETNQEGQQLQQQRIEIQKLLEVAHAYQLKSKNNLNNATTISKLKTLKTFIPNYQPSRREFEIIQELGEGNYSRVVAVRHVVTNEHFALKIIEKKKCQDLAKRQHPNVWNEIEMEKKILGERLWNDEGEDENGKKRYSWCRRIVHLYHTFKDYGNLYFLESLDVDGWDMWSTLRFKSKMIGTHASLAKIHLFELLEALEFIHERGIVHRDIKAENILLSPTGHVILIDFGTAKDLIDTKFNGPEFVGTPDFMAPEAVNGASSPEDIEKQKENGGGADHTLDLWCFGVLAFQLLTGTTPFSSPSQYLAYLKIQRGLLCRPMGITDDDAWNLITSLVKVNPKERLGAECYEYDTTVKGKFKIIKRSNGYSSIRDHPYFASMTPTPKDETDETRVFPSLRDLCLRAVAELVEKDSQNLDIDKEHPQGCGSSHDMLRLNQKDRGCVMDILEKLRSLNNPRVYRRFFKTKQDARLTKVRQSTRDFIGLTQMRDKQYQFPVASSHDNIDTERSDVLETVFPILYMHLSNPLFLKEINLNCTMEERKEYISKLKDSLRAVNRTRPKLVVASGYLDEDCRKLLGKINESIPVVLNDGESFFSFWCCGGQGIVLRSYDYIGDAACNSQKCEQMQWLREQLEQSEITKHHTYAFVDCSTKLLPKWLIKKLAKGRVQCLFGVSNEDGVSIESSFHYKPSRPEENQENIKTSGDDESQSSTEIEEEGREMKILERIDASLRCWKLEEYGAWNFENIT